jgi:ribosomal protein L23
MKFQRSTVILAVIAIMLAGGVYIFEIRGKAQREEIQAKQDKIFDVSKDDIQSLTIQTDDKTLKIERVGTDETDAKSPWKLVEPVQSPANLAMVDGVLNQLVASQSDPSDPNSGVRSLTISKSELPEYGLEASKNTIDLQLKDNTKHRLILGKSDFSGNSIYAIADPPETFPEQVSMLVISDGAIAAISPPLEEWKLAEEPTETPEPEAEQPQESSPSPTPETETPSESSPSETPETPTEEPETSQ